MYLKNNWKCACVFVGLFILVNGCKHIGHNKTPQVFNLKEACSSYYTKGDFKEAFLMASSARQTYHQEHKPQKEAESLLLMCDARIMLGALKSADTLLKAAGSILKSTTDDSLLAVSEVLNGDIQTALQNAGKAKINYDNAKQVIDLKMQTNTALISRLNLSQIKLLNQMHKVTDADSLIKLETSNVNLRPDTYYDILLLFQEIKMVNENGSPDSAMSLTKVFEKKIRSLYPENNYLKELLYNAYSGTAVNAMDYTNCISYARKELTLAHINKNPAELFNAYYSMKNAYLYNQDLKHTLLFTDSSSMIQKADYPESSVQASMVNSAYGKAYLETHDYAKSQYYLAKNIKLDSLVFGGSSEELANDYISIANMYYGLNQFNTMIFFMKKGLAIKEKIYKPGDLKIALAMDDIARCYDNMEKPEIALPMQQKIEKIYIKNYGPTHSYVAWAYDAEADSYDLLKQYDKAIKYNNKAFSLFIPEILKDASALGKTSRIPFDLYIPDYFASRVLIYYNHSLAVKSKPEKINLLKQAYDVADASNNYMQSYSEHYDSPESVATVYQRMYDYYKLYTDVSAELFELTGEVKYRNMVLNFAENKRGSFLRSNILTSKSISFSGVPDSILKKEVNIKNEVTAAFKNSVSVAKRDSINRKYEAFSNMLSKKYQNYYKLKYSPYSLNTKVLQNWLPNGNTYFAEYIIGKTNIYLIVISKENSFLIKLIKDDSLLSQISNLNELLLKSDAKRYYSSAYKIYQGLVKPMDAFIKAGSKVIMSGDGELSTLSFEALVTKPKPSGNGFNAADFLFNRYNFSYAVSAFSLLNPFQKGINEKGPEKVYFSAPGFDDKLKDKYEQFAREQQQPVDQSYLSYLYQPFMLKLGNALANSWNITKEEGGNATEADFKVNAPASNVIQVGSHAILNDIDPMRSCLVFAKELSLNNNKEDGYLYSSEIYNQKLNADLVILTACETGGGKFKEGEGMMSLAYSFEYAGCKSAMMSLWPVDEKTSALITENFYKYLSNGKTTTDALYRAKKDYLAKAEGPLVNPFYWSGLVMLGEDKKIMLSKKSKFVKYSWLYAALSLSAIGALGYNFRKRKQAA